MDCNNGLLDSGEKSTNSDPNNGSCRLQNLLPGTCVVRVNIPSEFSLTIPLAGFHQVTADAGDVSPMLVFRLATDNIPTA